MGCDLVSSKDIPLLKFQSTHPHGVRQRNTDVRQPAVCFNPRTHMGCDPGCGSFDQGQPKFQSTHPHGVRPKGVAMTAAYFKFQSTHPHGVRHHSASVPTHLHRCFNPRTHMGCDIADLTLISSSLCFNPRTHMGCDPDSLAPTIGVGMFQSTHPHGVRLR